MVLWCGVGEDISAIEKITISLPAEMIAEIRAAIEAGEFANVSEAVRDALRQWRRARAVIALNDEELRRLAAEGRESGDPVDGEATLRRLREKYAAMVAGR
jgi:antitoxin ParD1/3/4